MLVLTIDDDELVRESMAVYLEDSGFDVLEAENGQRGIQLFREHHPDVILCDLRMPDLDGMQVLEVISKESPNTPVIIISGAGIISNVVEALRLGASDYLVKPILDMAILEQAIDSAFINKEQSPVNESIAENENIQLEENLIEAQFDKAELTKLQQQLLPNPLESINGFNIKHQFLNSDSALEYAMDTLNLGERYLAVYLAKIGEFDSQKAFMAMMLKSFVSQAYRRFRTNNDKLVCQPANLLRYLNLECHKAEIPVSIPAFFICFDRQDNRVTYASAGLFPSPQIKIGAEKVELSGDGMALGMFPWTQYQSTHLPLSKKGSWQFAFFDEKNNPLIEIENGFTTSF